MLENKLKNHYLRLDFRINSLKTIINIANKELQKIEKDISESNGVLIDMYNSEIESLVGICLISFQNYINGSIHDLFPDLKKIHSKYDMCDKFIENTKITRIKLIIVLANYYKHRDSGSELRQPIPKTLNQLKIKFIEEYEHEEHEYFANGERKYNYKFDLDSPVLKGLSIISHDWNLLPLLEIVKDWRENLWKEEGY